MITVICTQCRARLDMDDAFAGGVCRCQHCGTIQTVPSMTKLKRQMAPTPTGAASPAPAASHAAPVPDAPASGLDELADAVAGSSSGLGRSALRSGPRHVPAEGAASSAGPAAAPAPPVDYARPTHQKRPTAIIVASAVGVALLLAFLGAMFFSTSTVTTTVTRIPPVATAPPTTGDPAATTGGGEGDAPVIPTGPHFCGVSLLGEPSVVYVLDRGQATGEMFDTLKEATFRSLESLKPGQKFAVLFWNNGGDEAAYPAEGLADVKLSEIQAARERFADVYAGSRADPHETIKRAAALKPGVVVLVTGKAFDLDEDLVDVTTGALAGGTAKVHTFALGSDDGTQVLSRISQATGGQTRVLSKRELRAFSD